MISLGIDTSPSKESSELQTGERKERQKIK